MGCDIAGWARIAVNGAFHICTPRKIELVAAGGVWRVLVGFAEPTGDRCVVRAAHGWGSRAFDALAISEAPCACGRHFRALDGGVGLADVVAIGFCDGRFLGIGTAPDPLQYFYDSFSDARPGAGRVEGCGTRAADGGGTTAAAS